MKDSEKGRGEAGVGGGFLVRAGGGLGAGTGLGGAEPPGKESCRPLDKELQRDPGLRDSWQRGASVDRGGRGPSK